MVLGLVIVIVLISIDAAKWLKQSFQCLPANRQRHYTWGTLHLLVTSGGHTSRFWGAFSSVIFFKCKRYTGYLFSSILRNGINFIR